MLGTYSNYRSLKRFPLSSRHIIPETHTTNEKPELQITNEKPAYTFKNKIVFN